MRADEKLRAESLGRTRLLALEWKQFVRPQRTRRNSGTRRVPCRARYHNRTNLGNGRKQKGLFRSEWRLEAGEFFAGPRFTGGAARRFLRGSEPRRGRENGSRRSTAEGGS